MNHLPGFPGWGLGRQTRNWRGRWETSAPFPMSSGFLSVWTSWVSRFSQGHRGSLVCMNFVCSGRIAAFIRAIFRDKNASLPTRTAFLYGVPSRQLDRKSLKEIGVRFGLHMFCFLKNRYRFVSKISRDSIPNPRKIRRGIRWSYCMLSEESELSKDSRRTVSRIHSRNLVTL